jgi:hypothetical protein
VTGPRVLAAAGLAALALAAGAARADLPTLYVVFHPDRTLSASLADGTPVGSTAGAGTAIPAGTYRVQIDNSANVDIDFDLSGPGVKLVDNLSNGEELAAAYSETFQPSSTYTFRNDSRPALVWTFATSSATLGTPAPATTTTQTAPRGGQVSTDIVGSGVAPFRGSLLGTVSAGGAVDLTLEGRRLPTLHRGRYAITVADASARAGLVLQRLRRKPETLTGSSFVGKRTVTLDLEPGQWLYYASPARKRYFIVVA